LHRLAAGVNKSGHVIPTSTDDLIALYGKTAPKESLQRLIWRQLQALEFAVLLKKIPSNTEDGLRHRVRLLSCTDDYSSLWLSALPDAPGLRLDDVSCRLAVCLRLGVSPYVFDSNAPPLRCHHFDASGKHSCNTDLRHDPFHGLHCIFEQKKGRNTMHNKVLAHVLGLAKVCNIEAHKTPKGWCTVDNLGNKLDNKQPDGVVYLWGGDTVFDVRGVDNLCPTHLKANKKSHRKACDLAAADKNSKYKHIVERRNAIFQPFVFTTLGGLHSSAYNLVQSITRQYPRHLDPASKSKLIYAKLSELSMSIMKDNASIVQGSHRAAAA